VEAMMEKVIFFCGGNKESEGNLWDKLSYKCLEYPWHVEGLLSVSQEFSEEG
jgi:hypothetical protein